MPLFERAFSKLADAQTSLEQLLEATNAQDFRTAFNSFVTHARATTYALQKTGAHVDGFDDWYEPKRNEMRADQLLCFFQDARVADFHRGEQLLEVHDPDALIESGYSRTKYVEGQDQPKGSIGGYGCRRFCRLCQDTAGAGIWDERPDESPGRPRERSR